VVNVHCEIHPDMNAYVVVVPNGAWARPDSLGTFRLPALPAGPYTMRVWHPRLGECTRDITIARHGATRVEVSF
jgi:hypothetical protein